jgi:hypothetical protein
MLKCAVLALFAVTAWPASPPGDSVAKLISLVRISLDKNQTDTQIAKALHKMHLAEQLSEQVVEELVSLGVGPKTEAELERLRDISGEAPKPDPTPVFSHDAPPSADVQRAIIAEARESSLNYAQMLPDFICLELVRRFENRRGTWDLKDTLEVKLNYFGQKEKYELQTRNGRQVAGSMRDVGGTLSEGEFGSLLRSIFVPDSATRFRWDHWTTLRGRPAHVFQFRILPAQSQYRVDYRAGTGPMLSTVAGQHGFVYVDGETNRVVRIFSDADSMPRDFPVRSASTLLDYGFLKVGGREFLLPVRADVRIGSDLLLTRNLVEFQSYRKFASDATVTFQ